MDQSYTQSIPRSLPRLLYVGDVPVESTVGGSALLYRLLQDYPVDQLCIVETNIATSKLEHRLPDVAYKVLPYASQRLLNSRFNRGYGSILLATAKFRIKSLERNIRAFQSEAILTVAHGFSWLTAVAVAKRMNIPVHLIVHDDWSSFAPVLKSLTKAVHNNFCESYRQAATRFCVSPYMVGKYKAACGVDADVLYPSRAADTPTFSSPPQRVSNHSSHLKFAYAGSIHSQGQANNLISLANVIRSKGGTLLVYSPLTREAAINYGLDIENIHLCPAIPYKDLIFTLRSTADILFAPMNFELTAKNNMQLCFPSKLVDYTATGLPVLIWGPSYCSAVQWAKDNFNVAEVVEENSESNLEKAVNKLLNDSDYRYQIAINSMETGRSYFSYQKVQEKFLKQIMST